MCGICGFTGPQNRKVLENMADLIVHRGPDENGFYSDEKVNLGMRRLSIIDVLSGQQPVHNEDSSIWLVFNGEIYNFEYLRKSLEKKGHKFYTDHSDTEVLVHLYEEYGQNFVNELNGMFAIALWDVKKEALILFRDRMGVKPLFYANINGQLVFASEIKSILAYPGFRKDINYNAIYHYFSFKNIPSPLTAFKDIYSILPGEFLEFSRGKIEKKRYWKIRFNESKNYDSEEIESRIVELLQDAVKIRMISDVPFGAYLSGGVDSSVVVALMSKFMDKPVKTFTLGYEDALKNKAADLYFAREVSKAFNTEHYEYIMSHKEVISEIEHVLKAFDQPFSGTVSTFFLSKLISKHVKVALSGDGADELFGSYLAHRLAQPMHNFSSVYSKYKNGNLSNNEKQLLKPFDNNLDYLEKLYLVSNGDVSKWRYNLLTFKDDEKSELLSRGFIDNLGDESSLALVNMYFERTTTKDSLNQVLEVDWNSLLPDQVLAFVDFLSMAHSVEVRSPFLDYRLVEFVATIPGSLKIKDGSVKDILKRAVSPLLPPGVTKRPKEGFVLPIYNWLNGPLQNYILDILSPSRTKKHDFFKQSQVTGLVSKFLEGDNSVVAKVWNLMMFQIWWEQYFG